MQIRAMVVDGLVDRRGKSYERVKFTLNLHGSLAAWRRIATVTSDLLGTHFGSSTAMLPLSLRNFIEEIAVNRIACQMVRRLYA